MLWWLKNSSRVRRRRYNNLTLLRVTMAEMTGFLPPFLLLWSLLFVGATPNMITKRISEELEAGTLVVDLKRDARLDAHFNQSTMSSLRFSFLSSVVDNDKQQFFELDPASGLIRTSVRLDRDRICPSAVTCMLPLDVAIQPPHFRVVKLSIELLDVNDNPPKFPSHSVRTSVFESTHPGPFFPIQLAEDPDSPPNSVVRYSIHPSSEQFELMVTRSEGAIQDVQLVLRETLDREKKESYQIKIYAFDGGQPPKSGSVTVEVIVTDVNDHRPEFERSSYEVEVVENSPPKRGLLTVKATDADSGPNGAIRYKFSAKSSTFYGNFFSIDSETGQISLLRSLDYEQNTLITLEVLAQDQGSGSAPVMTRVTVNVRDVNDNEPEIRLDQSALSETEEHDGKQIVHVTEHCANNTYVVQMTIRDPDDGEAGRVQCFLHQGNKSKPDHFQLVELYDKEFSLVTTSAIDREATDRYELTVTCRDNGRPQLTSVQHLVIVIDDLNDNSPQFTQNEYDISVKENIGPFEVFLQVTATDADAKENGTVSYSLRTTDPETKDIFKIDRHSGAIWTTSPLDREEKDNYRFHVVASDGLPGDSSSRSSTALVTLRVLDVNDEAPRFLQARYNFTIYENQSPKTNVGQVTAFDPDLSPGNRFTYHLDPTTCPTNLFRIESLSGMISTKASLNREDKESYEFKVMARDEGLPGSPLESATVAIYVRDENDNAPTIYFPGAGNDTVYIPNTVPVGHLVTSVIARDPDVGDNARLTYVISDGNERGVFGIDPSTGELFVNSILSDYEMDTFRLLLIVQDGGTVQKKRTATLQVVVSAASHLQVASGQPVGNFRLSFSDTHLAVIVGIIGGCLVIALALALAVCCVRRRRRHGNATKGRPGDGGATGAQGSSGALVGVKYAQAGSNGIPDDHCSLGTGSGPSYMRDSIGLPEDLAPDDGYVIVNCTHPGDSVTSQMVYDRRSRLYSPKPELGKCQQCDEAMTQLQMSCSRPPPAALTSADYARFPPSYHRPIYTPIDYNQVMFSDAAAVLPISSPDWATSSSPHQRKPSFSQWLNSESFHLRQKGQAYNIADYGTLTRANGHARPANGDLGAGVTTLVDPQRNVMMTSHDGTIRAPPVVAGPKPLGLMGRHHVTSPSHVNTSSGQVLANDAPEGKNHVTSNASTHPIA